MSSTWPEADLRNLERHKEFDATSPWRTPDRLRPGVTAVLRVKNEARTLPWALPPLLRSTDAVVVVDNQSDDGSGDVAQETAERLGLSHRLKVEQYPFDVRRCGPEHLDTPPDSIHSLAYFNNWAFAHVRTTYGLKWDGDMVLTTDGEALLSAFGWQVGRRPTTLLLPRHSIYVESDRVGHLDLGLKNVEHYGYPMTQEYSHVKAFEWEFLGFPETSKHHRFPSGTAIEVKYLDQDEFVHWTDPSAFATSPRTPRKRREYAVIAALREGRGDELEAVHRIEAPPGTHILDHVAQTWLPAAPRPLVHETPRAQAR